MFLVLFGIIILVIVVALSLYLLSKYAFIPKIESKGDQYYNQ